MNPINPYAKYLNDREPLTSLAETPQRLAVLFAQLGAGGASRTYAPGKWTALQIVAHLLQCELMFGTRFRQALTVADYVIQPFDQDAWMEREPAADWAVVTHALLALRQWNLALWQGFSPEDRARKFTHPERGEVTIDWLLALVAGHELNHLAQLEAIAAG